MIVYKNYENNVDTCYYDSSNVLKSVCEDTENELKTVDIFFKGGKVYRYYDVHVRDYLFFKMDESQGKSFNKYMKKYKTEVIDNFNVEEVKQFINEHKRK